MDSRQAIELSSSALRASITPWGGYLTRLRVANGRDVVLAHRDEAGRKFDEQHLGCLVGRHAGRIRGGMFELDGWHHQLPCNGTDAHLHGGLTGFGAREWTSVDMRAPARMQTGMVSGHPQIVLARGYDHFFPVAGEGLRRAARVVAPDGRVAMELHTDQAGVQFYTGNGLHLPEGAKADRGYRRHEGFCLEAQGYPDAPNHRAFPDNDLRPGTTYRRVIEYRFETPGR